MNTREKKNEEADQALRVKLLAIKRKRAVARRKAMAA
jgi:hypothetical protein